MKITHLTTLKHKLQWLVLLAALLGVSQGVWGTQTYYVYGGTTGHSDSDLLGWTTQKATSTGDDSSFDVSIDLSGNTVNSDYYYGICRSCSKFLPNGGSSNDYNDHIIPDGITGSVTNVSVGKEGVNAGSCHFYVLKIRRTADVSSVTLSFAKTGNNYSQCNQTQKAWNISLSGASVDTWTLRGEFTDWSTNPVTFVRNNSVYSASIDLPASKTYTKSEQGATTGFKICKNGATWYGYNGTITSANASTSKNFNASQNCGLTTALAGTYTFNFTLSGGNPQVTVVYPSKLPTVPTVRWGKQPAIDGSKNIKATAYIAGQGCNGASQQSITNIRVRFWKEGDEENAQELTTADGTYNINNHYDVTVSGVTTIPATNSILMSCTEATNIYMEVAGKSEIGWSDNSDRVKILYTANSAFWTTDPAPNLTACSGDQQITLSSMVRPAPDDFDVVVYGTSTDAKSLFKLSGDVLTWVNTGKATGSYEYTFTFKKDGYPNATQNLTINYTEETPNAEIGNITASPSVADPIKPYTDITLSSSKSGNIGSIEWYVLTDKTRVILTPNSDGTQCVFRAKAYTSNKTYTIYAKGLTASCGETSAKSISITVKPNSEICPAE